MATPLPGVRCMFRAVITALAFIVAFLVVGLIVVAAAFSGGRRPADRPPGPSRTNRRWVAILVGVMVLALGVLVPALVIAAGRDSKKAPGGVSLTAADERAGRRRPGARGRARSRYLPPAVRDIPRAGGGERGGEGGADPRPAAPAE